VPPTVPDNASVPLIQSLDFNLDTDFLPRNFFRAYVKVKDQRHLIFATDAALSMLPREDYFYGWNI